jgi:hypothetical protein
MSGPRYWFPVRPARNGWGWGLPRVWEGWVVLLAFFVLLTGGAVALAPDGALVLAAWGLLMGALLLAICFWKGEPQSMRDERSP